MFLDDIGKAVGDVVGDVTSAVPKLDLGSMGKDIFNTVTSAELRMISGVAQSADTVANVFGGLDIFDSNSIAGLAHSGEQALGSSLRNVGQELTEIGNLLDPQSPIESQTGSASQNGMGGVLAGIGRVVAQGSDGPAASNGDGMFPQLGIGQLVNGVGQETNPPLSIGQLVNGVGQATNPPLPEISKGIGNALRSQRNMGLDFSSRVAEELNPQPLPPGPSGESFASRVAEDLNPQPLPPGPESQFLKLNTIASKLSRI